MPGLLAPIVLFTYDRAAHTARVLASLAANRLAVQSRLIVYCDGPAVGASPEQVERVAATRAAVRQARGFAEVIVREAATNQGLMSAIQGGVREVLDEYESLIVLEDDLEVSPGFLEFMNAALACYARHETVMHVTGYMFPVRKTLPATFFLKIMSSWGWGTWRRAFIHYEADATRLREAILGSRRTDEFNLDGKYDYMAQLHANADGRLRTWAVKWYATMFLRGGLTLFPHRSLLRNLGHDGSGQNSARTSRFDVLRLAESVEVAEIPTEENRVARRLVGRFLYPTLSERLSRLSRRFPRRWLRRTFINPFRHA